MYNSNQIGRQMAGAKARGPTGAGVGAWSGLRPQPKLIVDITLRVMNSYRGARCLHKKLARKTSFDDVTMKRSPPTWAMRDAFWGTTTNFTRQSSFRLQACA